MQAPQVLDDGQVSGKESDYRPVKTFKFLTKYERARILGTRATHIANGAQTKIDTQVNDSDPLVLAEKELEKGLTPLIIRRFLPDGTHEDVHVKWLLGKDDETMDA